MLQAAADLTKASRRRPVDSLEMEKATADAATRATVAVLADDLIWASRLRAAIERAGGRPLTVRDAREIGGTLVVIDLAGRAYDPIDAIRVAASAGVTVLAVARHDDANLRGAALDAGARRVLSYGKLFDDGPAVMARLMEGTL